MIKLITYLIFSVSISYYLFAQESEFKIQSYKPVELKKHIISLSLEGSGYGGNEDIKLDKANIEIDENEASRMDYYINAAYKGLKESEKGWVEWAIAPAYLTNSSENDNYQKDSLYIMDNTYYNVNENRFKANSSSLPIALRFDFRRYILDQIGIQTGIKSTFIKFQSKNHSNFFTEFYEENTWFADYLLRVSKNEFKTNNYQKNALINFYTGIVYGRTYEGFYSAKAIEIVSELRKAGFLKSEPDFEQMIAFAKIIHEEYERFYFDSRLKRIETYDRLLSFLSDENIIDNTPLVFAHVTDIYSYGGNINQIGNRRYREISLGGYDRNFIRPFGFETKLIFYTTYDESIDQREILHDYQSITVSYDSNFVEIDNDTTSYINKNLILDDSGVLNNGVELSFNYYLPINWNWQINTSLIGKINNAGLKDINLLKEEEENYNKKMHRSIADNYLSIGLKTDILYYLNSRTILRSIVEFQHSKLDRLYNNIEEILNTDSTTISDFSGESDIDLTIFGYNGGLIFYIRPELSLSLNFMFEKSISKIINITQNDFEYKTDELDYGFDMSIQYTIPWF